MGVLSDIKQEQRRLKAGECSEVLCDGMEEGALCDAAAQIICERHGFAGLSTILWPPDLQLIPASDWRTAMIQAAALIAIEIERMDVKAKRDVRQVP